jgi:hypothetical protein
MCPNSENGAHNFQLQAIVTEGQTIVIKVCILCNAED